MKNKKGFVMTETLAVTFFLVTIFSFIYVSIVPLIGTYEDIIQRETDIDIVYKLYNIRKLILADDNRGNMTVSKHSVIKCKGDSTSVGFSVANQTYCEKMMEFLGLNNDYLLVYVDDIYENLSYIKGLNEDMHKYIFKYQNYAGEYLILLDLKTHAIAHLLYES